MGPQSFGVSGNRLSLPYGKSAPGSGYSVTLKGICQVLRMDGWMIQGIRYDSKKHLYLTTSHQPNTFSPPKNVFIIWFVYCSLVCDKIHPGSHCINHTRVHMQLNGDPHFQAEQTQFA